MCRCCQSCFEDCYWYCIEERFCFDKNIANYNPDEDEYLTKKGKGFNELNLDNIDRPIVEQPGRQENGLCSKIREDDYRQIQTNVPFLAPEILAVFANSQIFHDNQPTKSLAIVHKSPSIHEDSKKHTRTESDNEKKLLKRLEGIDINSDEDQIDGENGPKVSHENEKADELILRPVPTIETKSPSTSSASPEDGYVDTEDEEHSVGTKTPVYNKQLRAIQSMPYFPLQFRPVSETDIFMISGSSTMISMTPEIPSISFSTLPKNYEDTPTIEKYKESVSLYSIQTSNKVRARETDFTMPRYFGKSDIIAQSVENLSTTKPPRNPHKKVEKSKRLKLIRANLPPLSIHINKEKSREKKIE